MAYRNGNNRRNFGGGYGNNAMNMRNMNPWDSQSSGGSYGGSQNMGAEALSIANNLLNNLLRNQNPPSLLDLPRGGNVGLGGRSGSRQMGNRNGNRNRRPQGNFGRAQKSGGGIRKQNAFDRAKKLLAKNSNKKKDSSSDEKDKLESVKESPYADVPNDMFYCHLCKKHMWDSTSFENHIKGRTHLMMREGIEESYRLKANMIRQEAKIAEQLKLIELDRLKRMGKSGKMHQREYCTMCDLNFNGHLSAHRRSDGHLNLKKFLHPKCNECSKEFPTRIEFDSHLLSPEHLKKASEKNTKVGERKKNTLNILTEEEEAKDVRPPKEKKKKVEIKKEDEEKKEGEAPAEGVEGEEKKEGEEEPAEDETKEDEEDANQTAVVEDSPDCILDFHDGDEIPVDVDPRIPRYNWQRPVGMSLIVKLECHECSICGKFFDNEKTAEIHSRTVSHHRQFIKFINDKSSDTKIAQKRAAAALEESERKKRKLEEENEQKATENGGGDDKMENGNIRQEEMEGDLYDPSEATADDEDTEMNDTNEADITITEAPNGKTEDIEMKEETTAPIKEEEKQEPIKTTEIIVEKQPETETPKPAITQPENTVTTTPAVQQKQSPTITQKTPAGGRGAAAQSKPTPRGRGRGRYNRY